MTKLPDNITTFRLMATAVSGANRFGSGEATLLATRPVVVRAALPRFVRLGDSLGLGASVNLRDRPSATVQLGAAVTGGALTGDGVRSLTVTDTQGALARFGVTIPDSLRAGVDVTRVTFTATDAKAGDGDALAVVLPIRPQGTPRAHTVIGAVLDTMSIAFSLPGETDAARSSLTFNGRIAHRRHARRLRAARGLPTPPPTWSSRAREHSSRSRALARLWGNLRSSPPGAR